MESAMPLDWIERRIFVIRGQKVMVDTHLAELYGVAVKRLNEQVRRNLPRFPLDFMFQLSAEESEGLRSQIATSKKGRGGRRFLPFAFTEQGVAMLSTVLNSERAIKVNIEIIRVFVRLRRLVSSQQEMVRRLDELEGGVHKHDEEICSIFQAIRELVDAPAPDQKRIGFKSDSF